MKFFSPPEQISKTEFPDANLILRHSEKDLMSRCKEFKSTNLKLTKKQIAIESSFSDSKLERYGDDIKAQSPDRIPPTKQKRSQTVTNGLKRPQMTPKEPSILVETVSETVKSITNGDYVGHARSVRKEVN